MPPLRICLVSAEVTPFAKTGGLGDVTAALAHHLALRGQDVRLFLPFYSSLDLAGQSVGPVDFLREVPLAVGGRQLRFSAYHTTLPGSEHQIYLIHCPALYDRPGLYTSGVDEALRFAFLSRAALECCQRMGWSPQVVHANDWHTALLPIYLKTVYGWDALFERTRTVLTIHNIGYQGVFGARVAADVGLAEHAHLLHQEDLQADRFGFLTSGILYADLLTTVSPTHALEIQTDEYGMGLQGLLRRRSDHLLGILNGVDDEIWDPATDSLIPAHYSGDEMAGKEENKRALLEGLSLPYSPGAPLLGLVSRLTAQKGIDLLQEVLPPHLDRFDLQLVALGSGETRYEAFFAGLQRRFPGKVCFYRGFSNELAHRIEAGADIFLMPSLYEPCGLNQMYSLRYGTPPVVRRTGGLADAVEHWNPATGEGTGFLFDHYTATGLRWALDEALATYARPEEWRRLVANGMARDFSWNRQIGKYIELYRQLAA